MNEKLGSLNFKDEFRSFLWYGVLSGVILVFVAAMSYYNWFT